MALQTGSPNEDAGLARQGEEIPADALLRFVRERADELGLAGKPEAINVLQFPGGRANLTYLVQVGEQAFVLRRPPLGAIGPGAHNMEREYTILSRLSDAYDRAPRAYCYCDDESVIGGRFFLMERRMGTVIRYDIPPEMRHHAGVERRVSFALVDALIDLHRVDYKAAGLADIGNPVGFLERQLGGWQKRWELSKTQDFADFDRIGGWLQDHLPQDAPLGLIHNDPKLDNCQFDPANPDRVTSVFDWEMTTIGHTLIDLGTLLAYWAEAKAQAQSQAVSALSIFAKPGFPSHNDIVQYYATRSGCSLNHITWYEAFAMWKSAVIAQQIYARGIQRYPDDPRLKATGARVPDMLATALACTNR